MTVTALVTRNDITATASQTSFTYTFRVLAATDMDVYQNGVLLSSGYTVNNVGNTTGGTVVLDSGVPVGQIVSLVLAMPLDRTTNYQNSGKFLADDVNEDFDKIYIGAVQNENEGGRSLRLKDVEPPTSGVDMTIPLKDDRKGKFLSFNATTGAPEVSSGTGADSYDSAAWSAYNFTGNGSTTAFVLGIVPHSENNTQVYIDGVYQQKDGYSLSGSTITFSVAPPNLSTIEVMVTASLAVGSTSSDLVSYLPAGTGAVATTVQTKLRESVSVKDFGATGDGGTDDTDAIQAAIDRVSGVNGGIVYFPSGTYKTSAELTLNTQGVVLQGDGGHVGSTKIIATHTTGAVIRVKQRSCGVRGMMLDSDSVRYAATVTDGHGIHSEGVDDASKPSLSRGNYYDLAINRQPLDGVHVAGVFEYGVLDLITVADCKRHGFALDDGTRSGRTNKNIAPFVFTLRNCRALECGGNALLLGISTQTNAIQQGVFENFEALGCCWSSSARESLFQIESYCNGVVFTNPDVEDQQYDQTTTSTTGSTRTANATPAKGFNIVSQRTTIINPYFSSLLSSLESNGDDISIEHPRIFAGNYGVNQANGFIFATAVDGVYFKAGIAQTTGATNLIKNQSNNANIFIDGKQYKGNTWTLGDFEIQSDGVERTVASGTLEISEDFVFAKGQGDTTDSVTTLRLSSGINGFNGLRVIIVNRNAYVITLNHGTGNMYFASGANKALAQYQAVTLVYSETGNAWIES